MIIHLIAPKDQTKWPKIWHKCYNIWKSSPYKIKMWHDNDVDQLLKEDDEEFFNTLNSLPPIYKFDYVRYIILEKFGGAYFDMDVEIILNFIPLLKSNKIYLMEGTGGTYVENSIMITPLDLSLNEYWKRIKHFCKNKINALDISKLTNNNINYTVGSQSLSEYFIKHKPHRDSYQFDILGYHQFASIYNSLAFSRHHQTSNWNNI